MNSEPHYTQIFNQYQERGGEEACVDLLEKTFGSESLMSTIRFNSADWTGPDAPGRIGQALRMVHNPKALATLRRHEETRPSDLWLLHNLFPVGSAGIYVEGIRRGIPLVVMTHNFRPFSVNGYLWAGEKVESGGLRLNFLPEIRSGAWRDSRLQTGWYAMLLYALHLRGVFRKVAMWIAVSDFMRKRFIEAGIPQDRIHTLRHPWNPDPIEPTIVEDDGSFVFLGRLVIMKGIRFLVEAWDSLAQSCGGLTPILHICGEGPEKEWVEEHARRNPFIQVHGWVDGEAKRSLVRRCRALVVPSLWWEALGLVVYEAYAVGKPVISCRSGGLSEIVLDGETGCLIDPGDTQSLLKAVRFASKHPQRMAQMGMEGHHFMERNADPVQWASRLQELLNQART